MKTGEALREQIRARLAEMPFRGAPNFDDVVEAIAAAADHLGGGSDDASTEALKAKVQSLETRLVALQSTVDGLKAEIGEQAAKGASLSEGLAKMREARDRVAATPVVDPAKAPPAASTDEAAPDTKATKD